MAETKPTRMRSVFTLDISLGLFGFPVKVYKATNDPSEGVKFRLIHGACKNPINLVKRCYSCNVDVSPSDLMKGYELGSGKFLAFSEDEIKGLKPEKSGVLALDGYMAEDEIDAAYLNGTTYFLSPGGKDTTTFTTFRVALGTRWAVGKVVLYGREQVVAIRAAANLLAMHVIRPNSELRTPVDVPSYEKVAATAKADHIEMMGKLMDASTLALDDVAFDSDSYADAVKALVAARLAGAPDPAPAADAPVAEASDLMAMLKASLAAKKAA